jgi:hypothetical protein
MTSSDRRTLTDGPMKDLLYSGSIYRNLKLHAVV